MTNAYGAALLAAILSLFAGCKDGKSEPELVARLDAQHALGQPVTVGNLTVWPVFLDEPLDVGEFLTLQEAIEKGVAEVREVGGAAEGQTIDLVIPERTRLDETELPQQESEDPSDAQETLTQLLDDLQVQATVGTLVVENKGELPILVCAGTVVTGGNQDRQIAQDLVLKAKSTTPVDAFCVEQGRWAGQRLGKETDGKFVAYPQNASTAVRAEGQYEKDQGKVWEEVANVIRRATARQLLEQTEFVNSALAPDPAFLSENTSLAVSFDWRSKASGDELGAVTKAIREHFDAHAGAVGFAYAINGEPVNVRSFAHPRVFRQQFDVFVNTMATEASLAATKERKPPAARAEDVVALVKGIGAAEEKRTSTRALNANGVKRGENGFSATCYIRGLSGGEIALTRDWTAKR